MGTPPASALFVSLTDGQRVALGPRYLGRALEALEAEEQAQQHWARCRVCSQGYCSDYVRLHREAKAQREEVLEEVRSQCHLPSWKILPS